MATHVGSQSLMTPGRCRAYSASTKRHATSPAPSDTLTRHALDGGEDVAVSAASEFMLTCSVVLLLAQVPAKP